MNLPRALHRWDVSPARAIALQESLARRVRVEALPRPAALVAGGDAAFADNGRVIVAGWVVWDVRRGAIVEEVVVRRPVRFPYIPGLLSFRETPALLAAARRLKTIPDVFMLDGQGLAHPRRFGLACHFGLLADRPTLGCAKTRLCGLHDTPARAVGAGKPLRDGAEVIGRVVRMQRDTKPVYISIGHRITLDDAVATALRCAGRHRLPEPTRLADALVGRSKGAI